jgi:hypothetical protein
MVVHRLISAAVTEQMPSGTTIKCCIHRLDAYGVDNKVEICSVESFTQNRGRQYKVPKNPNKTTLRSEWSSALPADALPQYPVASNPTRTLTPLCFSSHRTVLLLHRCGSVPVHHTQWLGVITEQWPEGGYVIDFKVGQSFGEPQGDVNCLRRADCGGGIYTASVGSGLVHAQVPWLCRFPMGSFIAGAFGPTHLR